MIISFTYVNIAIYYKYTLAKGNLLYMPNSEIDYANVNSVILHASTLMDSLHFNDALGIIDNAISIYANNYELIYMKAICSEHLNNLATAYYLYKLSIYIAQYENQSEDVAIIQASLNQLCNNSCDSDELTSYNLNKALENIIKERIHNNEFIFTFKFLDSCIYDSNKTAANIAISENTTLLYIMLEVYMHETSCDTTYDNHIFKRYNYNLDAFKHASRLLRFMLRRIRFGLDCTYQQEINNIIKLYNISGEEIITTLKYCIDVDCWCDVIINTYDTIKASNEKAADCIFKYYTQFKNSNIGNKSACMKVFSNHNNATITNLNYLDYNIKYAETNLYANTSIVKHNNQDIAIIFCTNDKDYYNECCCYLKRLIVPDSSDLNIIAVHNAPSMAAGYNLAMKHSNAHYKIYIHHDTFIIDTDILNKLIHIFSINPDIGLIGNSGSLNIPSDGEWWSDKNLSNWCYNLFQDNSLQTNYTNSYINNSSCNDICIKPASAIDGIFMATDTDIQWRDDLFDNWHFYDISQTMEFKKNGYTPAFICTSTPMLLHELSITKHPISYYENYRKIFVSNYSNML